MASSTGKMDKLIEEFCGKCKFVCTEKRKRECYEWFESIIDLEDVLDVPEADV